MIQFINKEQFQFWIWDSELYNCIFQQYTYYIILKRTWLVQMENTTIENNDQISIDTHEFLYEKYKQWTYRLERFGSLNRSSVIRRKDPFASPVVIMSWIIKEKVGWIQANKMLNIQYDIDALLRIGWTRGDEGIALE